MMTRLMLPTMRRGAWWRRLQRMNRSRLLLGSNKQEEADKYCMEPHQRAHDSCHITIIELKPRFVGHYAGFMYFNP